MVITVGQTYVYSFMIDYLEHLLLLLRRLVDVPMILYKLGLRQDAMPKRWQYIMDTLKSIPAACLGGHTESETSIRPYLRGVHHSQTIIYDGLTTATGSVLYFGILAPNSELPSRA